MARAPLLAARWLVGLQLFLGAKNAFAEVITCAPQSVDMVAHAMDYPAPSTVILISGNRDFAHAVSILRLRRYRVVIISPPGTHISLASRASVRMDWNLDVLGMAPKTDATPLPRPSTKCGQPRAYIPSVSPVPEPNGEEYRNGSSSNEERGNRAHVASVVDDFHINGDWFGKHHHAGAPTNPYGELDPRLATNFPVSSPALVSKPDFVPLDRSPQASGSPPHPGFSYVVTPMTPVSTFELGKPVDHSMPSVASVTLASLPRATDNTFSVTPNAFVEQPIREELKMPASSSPHTIPSVPSVVPESSPPHLREKSLGPDPVPNQLHVSPPAPEPTSALPSVPVGRFTSPALERRVERPIQGSSQQPVTQPSGQTVMRPPSPDSNQSAVRPSSSSSEQSFVRVPSPIEERPPFPPVGQPLLAGSSPRIPLHSLQSDHPPSAEVKRTVPARFVPLVKALKGGTVFSLSALRRLGVPSAAGITDFWTYASAAEDAGIVIVVSRTEKQSSYKIVLHPDWAQVEC